MADRVIPMRMPTPTPEQAEAVRAAAEAVRLAAEDARRQAAAEAARNHPAAVIDRRGYRQPA